ncbi:MAG TPA: serine protease [Candidatus Limnocylindrales bacterium]|nr:serine protease [Candidatus Limnocylindrales bacterium]
MVRAVLGAKGEQRNGSYVVTDRRTTFYIPEDREVIVYFEWEGPTGKHHCEGSVRGPHGEFAVMSSFDYTSTQGRFAGYWKMPISESTPAGNWVFESSVDGESAGQVTFQLVPGTTPAALPKEALLPSVGDLYKLALSSTVQIEKLDSNGKVLRTASAFLANRDQVITSFRVIDGATALRLRLPDGRQISLDRLLAWNRRQDWAILGVNSEAPSLKIAEPKSWTVGDPCYWLDSKVDSSRILSQGQIVGIQLSGPSSDRIDISGTYTSAATGGPLLNERGQVIGILGGLRPESLISRVTSGTETETESLFYSMDGGTSVPTSLLPQSLSPRAVNLNELWAKGEMMPPITNSKYVSYGSLSAGSAKGTKLLSPGSGIIDTQVVFHRSDSTASAGITFANTENLKSTTQLNLYDLDNHPVALGKPQKLAISRGEFAERLWQISLAGLPPAIYRIDLVIGDGIAWRQFFKLAE